MTSRETTGIAAGLKCHLDVIYDIALRICVGALRSTTIVTGQHLGALMVGRMAQQVLDIDAEIADTDALIEDALRQHHQADIIMSMPGFGCLLGAELLAATTGGLASFHTVDRLAAIAGLAPVPRDSGRIRGTLKRTRSYDRRLLRVFYLAAYNSIRTSSKSRAYYDRKRAEGKHHTQAILSAGQATSQCAVGHAARRHKLSTCVARGRLTTCRVDVAFSSGRFEEASRHPFPSSALGRSPHSEDVDRERVFASSALERHRLADLVDDLNETQLATPSLCAGWNVKTVAAHLVR